MDNETSYQIGGNVENKSLRDRLLDLGASESQLNAKVVGLIEESMIDDEAVRSATVRSEMKHLHDQVNDVSLKFDSYIKALLDTRRELAEFRKELSNANVSISEHTIKDSSVIDGILAYRKTLESTVEVFGSDKMSDDVMIKAIEAASYGMWRSVTPQNDSSNSKQRSYRL